MNSPWSAVRTWATLSFLVFGVAPLNASADSPWSVQNSGTTTRLRGLSVVSPKVAWVAGAYGTCLRTTDAGDNWTSLKIPEGSNLDFRDVHAFSPDEACLLAIGVGEQSRIYRTTDGGVTWTATYINRDPRGFLDALAFWNDQQGIALGDPVDGQFVILTTNDGGKTWDPIPHDGMPAARPNEGAFAASGSCLTVQGDKYAWFGTGSGVEARIFRSVDRGQTWTVHETPLPADAPSKGIFSIAFRDPEHGLGVGGDYKEPGKTGPFLIKTSDGGKTWTVPLEHREFGFRSAVTFVPGSKTPTFLTVGPAGAEISRDDGQTWTSLDLTGYHAVEFRHSAEAGWAVGERGVIAKFDLTKLAPK